MLVDMAKPKKSKLVDPQLLHEQIRNTNVNNIIHVLSDCIALKDAEDVKNDLAKKIEKYIFDLSRCQCNNS